MVARVYEIYLRVLKSISHECRAQFCLLYKPTYYDDLYDVLDDFPINFGSISFETGQTCQKTFRNRYLQV